MKKHFNTLYCRGLACIAILALATAANAAGPTTQPLSAGEIARLQRGVEVRRILLDAIDQAYENGQWPDHLAPDAPNLVYSKPVYHPKDVTDETTLDAIFILAATVVVHEDSHKYTGGVWVSYADGHLEFATDPDSLAACKNQIEIAASVKKSDEIFRATRHQD